MDEVNLTLEQRSLKRANRALALTISIDSVILIVVRLGMILQGNNPVKMLLTAGALLLAIVVAIAGYLKNP